MEVAPDMKVVNCAHCSDLLSNDSRGLLVRIAGWVNRRPYCKDCMNLKGS